MIALEHAAALLAAIVTVLAALPLAAAICFALGGFACATLLVAVIASCSSPSSQCLSLRSAW